MKTLVAHPYAEALLDLAQAERSEDACSEALQVLAQAIEGSDLKVIFQNPQFSKDERRRLLQQICDRLKLSRLMDHFLQLLVDRERISILPTIAQVYRQLLNDRRGVSLAKVQTAAPLTAAQLQQLKTGLQKLSRRPVELEVTVDPGLIGGLSVEMDGVLRDGSVRGQLEHLRTAMKRAIR